MDIRSFLLTLIVALSAGLFIGFTLRDISQHVVQQARKHLIKPRFLKPYQSATHSDRAIEPKVDA